MFKFSKVLSLLVVLTLLLTACGAKATATQAPAAGGNTGGIDCMGAKSGDTVSMLYQWSGVEETHFSNIMQPLVKACGIVLKPESTRDQGLLDTRVKAGTPPDVAMWNLTQLVQYKDILKPMDSLGASKKDYITGSTDPGTVDGKWLGLPVKTDLKTTIWYSPANFQASGYEVPKTWDELNSLVDKMVAD